MTYPLPQGQLPMIPLHVFTTLSQSTHENLMALNPHNPSLQALFQLENFKMLLPFRQSLSFYDQNGGESFSIGPQLFHEKSPGKMDYEDSQMHLNSETSFVWESVEQNFAKIEETSESSPQIVKKEEDGEISSVPNLKNQVTEILFFFINTLGRSSKDEIYQHRTKFQGSDVMLEIFDTLFQKYTSTRKCKEDMIRSVLRKALTYLRDSLRAQLKVNARSASVILCKKYFGGKSEDKIKQENDKISEDEILNLFLPYKKNSRNKTPNMCFIREIFSSELFKKDYYDYLLRFNEISELENKKKISKFAAFIMKCVQNKNIHSIKGYRMLPWLKTWLDTAKKIAFDLLYTGTQSKKVKRLKVQEPPKVEVKAEADQLYSHK